LAKNNFFLIAVRHETSQAFHSLLVRFAGWRLLALRGANQVARDLGNSFRAQNSPPTLNSHSPAFWDRF